MKNKEKRAEEFANAVACMLLFLFMTGMVIVAGSCDDDVKHSDDWNEELQMYEYEIDLQEQWETEREINKQEAAEKAAREEYLASSSNPCNDSTLVEALKRLGEECNPYDYYGGAYDAIMKASGLLREDDQESELSEQDKNTNQTKDLSVRQNAHKQVTGAYKNLKDMCINTYLGAKYKKGKCEFPVYERMNGRAGLEKKFENCQINKIIVGKGNTATAHAVCNGVPSIIKVKRYYQKGR